MRQCHVLIVEDVEEIAEIEAAVVGRLGVADSTIVLSGDDAISTLGQRQFDLIILDLSLPDLPGQAVLDFLEQDAKLRAIPVIVVSANVDDLRQTAQLAKVLVKPVDFFEMVDVITKAVKTWQRMTASDQSGQPVQHVN